MKRIALTASDPLIFVETVKIIYCESDSNYTIFFLTDGQKIIVFKTLKDVEEILEGSGFFRIHASYLINMKHVSKFTRGDGGYVVMRLGCELAPELGHSYGAIAIGPTLNMLIKLKISSLPPSALSTSSSNL